MPSCWSEPTTKDAYRLCYVSLVLTLAAAVGGVALYVVASSTLALVYGLENGVDFLSSAVVLWRFFAPKSLDPVLEQKLRRRETRASMAISFILVLLGIGVIVTAADDLEKGDEGIDRTNLVEGISVLSIFVFGVLAALKFRYSKVLDSPSLFKDGICSLIGAVLSLALVVNTIIIDKAPQAWWIDPFVSLVAGFVAILVGLQAIFVGVCKENQPVFTLSWWFLSQGEGSPDGITKDPNEGHELNLKEQGTKETEDAIV